MTASDSEKLLSKVSQPPPGSFDFESPSLKWEDGTYNKTTFKKVYIQADRFPDFLRGERERGLSDFYVRNSSGKGNIAAGSIGDKENCPDNGQHCFHASEHGVPKKGYMQCECGPQDLRGKQPTVQGKQAGTRVKRSEMGLSVRVGCPVHFRFKTLPAAPSIMELRYYASHHLNHGKAAQGGGLESTFKRVSPELKETVRTKLLQGLEPAEIVWQNSDKFISSHMLERGIMDRDEGRVSLESSQPPRDYYLSYADVANIKEKVDREQWKFSENTQQSVRMFVEQHAEDILLYKEQEPIEGTPDYEYMMQQRTLVSQAAGAGQGSGCLDGQAAVPFYTDLGSQPAESSEGPVESAWRGAEADLDRPETINLDRSGQASVVRSADANLILKAENWCLFELAWMKKCNVVDAIRFGHGRPLIMDATFGTNREKFPLITILAVDDHNNGVPIAWSIISQERTEAIAAFLEAVRQRVRREKPDWEPSCILVDACAAEIAAIQMTFPSTVCPFICHWHAQSAWKKQLFQKCNREGKNSQPNVKPMFEALLEIMRFDPATDDIATARRLAKEKVDNFLERFASEEDFCKYFKAQWADKLEMICQVFRRLKGCNINCTSHAEGYHSSLKANFLHGKRRLTARRIDWLAYTIHSRFVESSQVSLHRKDVGRVRNHDAFYKISNLILKAQRMPDGRVKFLGMGAASVPSLSKPGSSHSVKGANSDSSQPSCTCPAAQKDGQCWHIIKALMLYGASAKSLLQCLGLFKGSSLGGYPVLYAQMAAAATAALLAANPAPEQPQLACLHSKDVAAVPLAAAAVPSMAASDPVQCAALDDGDADASTQVEQTGSQMEAAGVSTRRRRTGCDRAMAAISRLSSLGKHWEPDSAGWELLEHHALRAVHDVEKALANKHTLAPASFTARMLPNPDALLHNSLERGKGWLEKLPSRKRKSEGSPADARPEACRLLPAAPRRKGKEGSVLEEIERRVRSSGVFGAAAAAAAVPAAAAGGPPCSGSGLSLPAAVDSRCPAAAVPAVDPAEHDAELARGAQPAQATSSTRRVKRATQGLQPSRFRL